MSYSGTTLARAPVTTPRRPLEDRYHALDATRAFALLLGVVFHAAWSFCPPNQAFVYSAPVVDQSTHSAFGWFFFTSHSFRMQLFFLIAGFFARLLYIKRGPRGFARHRFLRIVLPLVVGWIILYPLVMSAWIGGANLSGRNLTEQPLPVLLYLQYGRGLAFIPAEHGGMFSLGHVWFLYYLAWLCAITLVAAAVLQKAPARVAVSADQILAFLLDRPRALLVLTVAMGVALWPMDGWWGVDTPVRTLRPSLPVLTLYGAFFLLGWILHRNPLSLRPLTVRWRWHLLGGLAVSAGCFAGYRHLADHGYINGSFRASYPNLSADQITDWEKFFSLLRSPVSGPASPELTAIWSRLPEASRNRIASLPANPTANQKAGVCDALNTLLLQQAVLPVSPTNSVASPSPRGMASQRPLLESIFAGAIITDPEQQPNYALYKLAYSFGYALMMWLLVFGTLGVFHACFDAESPRWRYVSDSAYWVYLAHLPLVAWLQVWFASWAAPALIKFPLLLALAFTVLFASYHYLVRSTPIGAFLNGQRHPFTPLPFARAPR